MVSDSSDLEGRPGRGPRRALWTPLGAVVAWGLTFAAAAQAQQSTDRARVDAAPGAAVAVRAAPAAPRLDGRLDDPAWTAANPIADFTQRDPREGEPATERTEVRVVYTDDAIYVGVRAHDSQADRIAAHLTRRDEWSPSDWIAIAFDSYRDRRTAFYFAANAAGVKRDIYFYDDNNEDDSWDANWDVSVRVDDEGWTAEFRIPFSQLRFGKAERHEWGFNVYRRINRLNEEQYWRLPPKNQSGIVSRFGDLVGIEGIAPPRRIEVTPYVSGTSGFEPTETGNPFQTGDFQTARMGADLNIGVTSNLTLSATVNPDFGQVEADPAVVNLSAFETFFTERRPFFNEGIDIFRFSLSGGDGNAEQLFYTRRIGRQPQGSVEDRGGFAESVQQTTILGAAKLSGKTPSGWTIGLLGSVTAEEKANAIDAAGNPYADVVEPRTGYFVGRVARDFRGGLTQVGLFATAMDRALPDNLAFLRSNAYTAGINWSHRFRNDTYGFSGWLVGSHVRGSAEAIDETQRSSARYYQRPDNDYVTYDPTRTSLSGYSGQFSFGKRGGGSWRFSTGIDTRSPGFEVNDLGFQRDADRTLQWLWLNKRWLQPGKVFRRFNLNFNQWALWNYGWDRINAGGNVNFNYTFANYWGGWGGMGRQVGGLSSATLRGGPGFLRPGGTDAWVGFFTDSRKDLRGEIWGFGFKQDESDTWEHGFGVSVAWRAASNLDFRVGPHVFRQRDTFQYLTTEDALGETHYVFGELRQTTTSMTFRGNATFTPTLSLQLYAEPFVSSGRYEGFRQIADPRGAHFADRFDDFGPDRLLTDADGNVGIDLDRDGAVEIELDNPDFTFLSFRSNVVLRWEYKLGSTIFLVWQHGRTDFTSDGRFRLGSNLGSLFEAPQTNTFLVKVNYWLSL